MTSFKLQLQPQQVGPADWAAGPPEWDVRPPPQGPPLQQLRPGAGRQQDHDGEQCPHWDHWEETRGARAGLSLPLRPDRGEQSHQLCR